jgi:hypothetical protein
MICALLMSRLLIAIRVPLIPAIVPKGTF